MNTPEPPNSDLNADVTSDAALSKAYQQLEHGEVPAELDQLILKQARAAIAPDNVIRPTRWQRWSKPMALAASLLVVATVAIELNRHSNLERDLLRTAPAVETLLLAEQQADAPQAAASESASPAASVNTPASAALADTAQSQIPRESRVAARESAAPSTASALAKVVVSMAESPALIAAAPAPAAPPPPPAPSFEASVDSATASTEAGPVMGSAVRSASSQALGVRPLQTPQLEEIVVRDESRATRTPAARSPVSSALQEKQNVAAVTTVPAEAQARIEANPETWLQQIRALRSQGKQTEADAAWRRFANAWPNHVVAADDPARSKSSAAPGN